MALAKPVGFDLCPRLPPLAGRTLFVPRDVDVPASLEGIIDRSDEAFTYVDRLFGD